MAQDKTALYNMGALALGSRAKFVDADLTATTRKHRVIETFDILYDDVRKRVFKAAWWPSLSANEVLSQIYERTADEWAYGQPSPGWKYSHALPDDYVYARHLNSYDEFALTTSGGTQILNSHNKRDVLLYTFDNSDLSSWDFELFSCVAYTLAAFASLNIVGVANRAKYNEEQANKLIEDARASAANVTTQPVMPVAARHAVRMGINNPQGSPFTFPFGPLINIQNSANVK